MMALAALCGLVSFVCAIIILIHAFTKGGVLQGFLCLCIPFYILYYAFAKFEHPKKNLILGVWLSAIVLQVIAVFAGGMPMQVPVQ
jgi:translocator protein